MKSGAGFQHRFACSRAHILNHYLREILFILLPWRQYTLLVFVRVTVFNDSIKVSLYLSFKTDWLVILVTYFKTFLFDLTSDFGKDKRIGNTFHPDSLNVNILLFYYLLLFFSFLPTHSLPSPLYFFLFPYIPIHPSSHWVEISHMTKPERLRNLVFFLGNLIFC